MMAHLNRAASEAALAAGARAATDVTGYGLIGHLGNMLRASGVSARIASASVPVLEGVVELAEAGHVPGGTRRNQTDAADAVSYADGVDDATAICSPTRRLPWSVIATRRDRPPPLLAESKARGDGERVRKAVEGPAGQIVVA